MLCAFEDVNICCIVCIFELLAAFQILRDAAILDAPSFDVVHSGCRVLADWCARLLVHAGKASEQARAAHHGDINDDDACVWALLGISFLLGLSYAGSQIRALRCGISPIAPFF